MTEQTKIQPESETLRQVSDATLENAISLSVDIAPVNRVHKTLQRWGIMPKAKSFELKPIYLGSLIRISKLLLGIDLKMPEPGSKTGVTSFMQANYDSISKHTETMAQIVAIAIQNNDKLPGKKLVSFVMRNFTTKEMNGVIRMVLQQMDLQNFMLSIISIKGLNVLEAPAKNAAAESAEN